MQLLVLMPLECGLCTLIIQEIMLMVEQVDLILLGIVYQAVCSCPSTGSTCAMTTTS
jgi:hypothetical protein